MANWIERNRSAGQAEAFRKRLGEILVLAEEVVSALLSGGRVLPHDWRHSVAMMVDAASTRPAEVPPQYKGAALEFKLTIEALQGSSYVTGWADEMEGKSEAPPPERWWTVAEAGRIADCNSGVISRAADDRKLIEQWQDRSGASHRCCRSHSLDTESIGQRGGL